MLYLSFKTLHVIAIISWMAGILYLFRLFVYHTENLSDSSRSAMLKVMERKLYKYITVPAMYVAWIAALVMIALNPGLLKQGWLHAKLLFVLALSVFTLYGGRVMSDLDTGKKSYTSKHLRILNEVPTLLMVAIVIFVIFRPF